MDTSEQYVKMSERAENILPYHNIEAEDFLGNSNTRKESVWLPRQDQLQEMTELSLVDKVGKFTDWVWEDVLAKQSFQSMEQLWLAFVMKEKYGKMWSGTEWKLKQ